MLLNQVAFTIESIYLIASNLKRINVTVKNFINNLENNNGPLALACILFGNHLTGHLNSGILERKKK